jgi:hypothetical protein
MSRGTGTDAGIVLSGDVRCPRCGYALGGLSTAMRCPECGAPAGDVLGACRLRDGSPEFLRTLAAGAGIAALAGTVGQVLGYPLLVATMVAALLRRTMPPWIEMSSSAVVTVFAWIGLWGVWLLSKPDPGGGGGDAMRAARRTVRGSLAVHAAGSVVLAMYEFGGWEQSAGYWSIYAVTLAAIVTNYFALLVYLRWLARRIPDGGLARFAARMLWLGPVLSIAGAAVFMLGPFAAVWLEIRLLLRFRRRLLEEARAARGESHGQTR